MSKHDETDNYRKRYVHFSDLIEWLLIRAAVTFLLLLMVFQAFMLSAPLRKILSGVDRFEGIKLEQPAVQDLQKLNE